MHFYSFNIGDYVSHTTHLDPLEDIAYRRMLDWIYLHESPLPLDVKQISKYIRMRDECERITDVLQEYFECTEYGYTHTRAMEEIEKYQDKRIKAKKAVEKRWAAKPNNTHTDVLRTQYECNTKQETRNKKQETINDQSEIDQLFEKFWEAGMRKVGKKKAKTSFINLLKGSKNKSELVDHLISDIQKRKVSAQLGFDEMHPSTYLNGERWMDDIPESNEPSNAYQGVMI